MKNMNEKMYLSDYMEQNNIDISKLGNKVCIISGVGSGKNYWIENELTKHGNVLLITSRKAKKDETVLDSIFEGKLNKSKLDNCVVYTNSGIESFIKNAPVDGSYDSLCNYFDYIVVDEAHSIVTDSTFADAPFHLWSLIKKLSEKMKFILMTGTIKPIQKIIDDGWQVYDCMHDCINIKPKRIIINHKDKILKTIEKINNNDEKIIYLANSAKSICTDLYKDFQEKSKIDKRTIAFSMSDSKVKEYEIDKKMNEEYKRLCDTYESIIEDKKLPDDIKLLITTSRLKEGINIKDIDVKNIFCESHIASDIIQFAGRVRTGLETLYIVKDAEQNNNYKLKEIDYKFCRDNGLEACNEYLKNIEATVDDMLQDNFDNVMSKTNTNKKVNEFVDFVESRLAYIRYNHIENMFEIYEHRHIAVEQVNNNIDMFNKNPEKYLKEVFNIENVIDMNEFSNKKLKTYANEILENYFNEHIQFYIDCMFIQGKGEQKIKGRDFLRTTLGKALELKGKYSDDSINEELKRRNLPYIIKSDGRGKEDYRNRRFRYIDRIE